MRCAAVAAACAVLAVAACSGSQPATQRGTPGPKTTAAAGCPVVSADPHGHSQVVDYVDFVQAYGRQYIAGLHTSADDRHITTHDLGRVVLHSRCSFSELNDRYHVRPPEPPHDGDTGFLPPGTPIHSVRGWPPTCRLAAADADGRLHLYLAYRDDTEVATPRQCAVRH